MSKSSVNAGESEEERVSGLTNADFLVEMDSLLKLMEEIGRKPEAESTNRNKLVDEIVNLVTEDWGFVMKEVWVRVKEFRERLGCLSFGETVELVCELKRIEERKEMMVMEKSFWNVEYWKDGEIQIGEEDDDAVPDDNASCDEDYDDV